MERGIGPASVKEKVRAKDGEAMAQEMKRKRECDE
ncbi:uncharacterized, partial [Tachysurus ichikawai]